jgi:hypothetical protein
VKIILFNNDSIVCSDTILPSNKILLIGEDHFAISNEEYKLDIISKLLNEEDTINVLIEGGHAKAYMYTMYFTTGDLKYLEQACVGLYEYECIVKKIRNISNSNFCNKKCIKFYGIDYERNTSTTLIALFYILQKVQDSNFSSFRINDFYNAICGSKQERIELINNFINVYNDKSEYFKEILGENYFDLELIIEAYLLLTNENKIGQKDDIVRERWMYNNIVRVIGYSDSRTIAFLGSEHTSYYGIFSTHERVGQMLKQNRYDVCCIYLFYPKPTASEKKLNFSKKDYKSFLLKYKSNNINLISTNCDSILMKYNYRKHCDYVIFKEYLNIKYRNIETIKNRCQ